jgi:hypothetical protein
MCYSIMRASLSQNDAPGRLTRCYASAVMSPPIEQLTAQSYDLQFGTNVLGTLFHDTQVIT